MIIKDIIFIDAMVVMAMNEDNKDGFVGHRLDNDVQEEDDLIKLWDGASAL